MPNSGLQLHGRAALLTNWAPACAAPTLPRQSAPGGRALSAGRPVRRTFQPTQIFPRSGFFQKRNRLRSLGIAPQVVAFPEGRRLKRPPAHPQTQPAVAARFRIGPFRAMLGADGDSQGVKRRFSSEELAGRGRHCPSGRRFHGTLALTRATSPHVSLNSLAGSRFFNASISPK